MSETIDLVGLDLELVGEMGKGPAQDIMDIVRRHIDAVCQCGHHISDHHGGTNRCYAASTRSDNTCACEQFSHVAPAPAAPDAEAGGFTKEELWLISEALYEHSEFVADDPDEHGLTGSDYKQLSHKAYLIGGGIPPFPRFTPDQEAAPDAGLRDRMVDAIIKAGNAYDQTIRGGVGRGWSDDDAAPWIADAILALLPPRIDGVTIPRELAERAAAYIELAEAWHRSGPDLMPQLDALGRWNDVRWTAIADADQLRALLGREGV